MKDFNYFEDESTYLAYVQALKAPESVNGYRQIRWPKMELARSNAEAALRAALKSFKSRPVQSERPK